MQRHLWNMAEQASLAVELQQKAAESTTAADELTAEATTDKAEAAELETQGEEIMAKGNSDMALADSDQAAANKLAGKAAEEEAAATTEFGEAAAEEAVVEEDAAKATADASLAARNGFEADEDEVVVGACSVVPVLDVVCDVVGGIAAVGLETSAAREAAKAAAEYAAAVTAQVEEDSLVAEATETQAAAARDGDVAAESQATATELRAQAEEELAEGEADEAATKEKLMQGTAEQEVAEEQEAEAVGEEEASSKAMQKSLQHGAFACWDAMMAGLVSLVALGFFTLRLFGTFIVPALTSVRCDVVPNMQSMTIASFPTKTAGHIFHHVLIFGLVAGAFGGWLATLDQLNLRSRGGILLELAALGAVVQSVFLHSLPHALFRKQGKWHERARSGALVLVRSILWLFPLFVLEVLLLRVNLGSAIFFRAMLLRRWYLWALFAATLLAHYAFVERRRTEETCVSVKTVVEGDVEYTGTHASEDDATAGHTYGSTDESTALIDAGLSSTAPTIATISTQSDVIKEPTFRELLWRDLQRLALPFELLMVTSMFALLRQSIPSLQRIWPASQAVLSTIHPHWHLAVLATAAACIVTLVICVMLSCHDSCAPSRTSRTL